MAVTFDANATASVTVNAATTITSSNLTVGSGSNRALIAQVLWSGANGGVTDFKWDKLGAPQAITAVTSATATNTVVAEVWALVNPTSGAKQISVTWTTPRDIVLNHLSYTSVDQTGGTTSFPHGTSGTGSATANVDFTIAVTSATGNAVAACFAVAAGSMVTPGGTATQTFLNNAAANMSTYGNRDAGAASVSMAARCDTAAAAWAGAGTDILAFTAAAGSPFTSSNFPNPSSAKFPSDLRTFLNPTETQFIGKDTQFAGPGQWKSYDYPNPRGRPHPSDLRTFTNPSEVQLIGLDTQFRGPGQWTTYDYPNPRGVPPPALLKTHLDPLKVNLLSQDTVYGAPGQPPTFGPPPNPRGAPYSSDLRTFTNSLDLQLLNQDVLFGSPGQVPTYQPPPNPRGATYPPDLRTFLNPTELQLLNQDTFFGGPGQPPSNLHFPVPPRPSRGPDLSSWINLLESTLGIVVAPFNLSDYPNPRGSLFPSTLRTFLDPLKLSLLGQDTFFRGQGAPLQVVEWIVPPGARRSIDLLSWFNNLQQTGIVQSPAPFAQLEWLVPKGGVGVIDLKTFSLDLLQTTLKPAGAVADSIGPTLIIVDGRFAKRLHGIIYVFLS